VGVNYIGPTGRTAGFWVGPPGWVAKLGELSEKSLPGGRTVGVGKQPIERFGKQRLRGPPESSFSPPQKTGRGERKENDEESTGLQRHKKPSWPGDGPLRSKRRNEPGDEILIVYYGRSHLKRRNGQKIQTDQTWPKVFV